MSPRRRVIEYLLVPAAVIFVIFLIWRTIVTLLGLRQIWHDRLPEIVAGWSVSDWVTNVGVIVLWLMVIGFTVTYLTVFRFWQRPEGLALAAEHLALSLVLTLIVLGIWTDSDFPGREMIRPAFYGLAILAVTFMYVRLSINWARGHRKIEVAPRWESRKKDRI